ncbi:DUF421 domain-containing protein [Pseudalkalibacillus caeni]|uniref:DUF421 domain-containing protein n=1 Tax=Exobacillus caeni TaxID=2574798 RepID=A0A5R9F9A4_9BACL|nr:DUF421 domain-containing protein [Pseudalkalibacillus caeni]TLS38208.1 DUF421 domain-containing protein [Pseudalkalibacillus caeni]
MFDFIQEYLIVILRIATILPLLLGITLFMGKRSVGEMPVFDYLVILTLGSVVGADIGQPEVKHMPTVIAVISIALLQKLVATLKVNSKTIGKLLTFETTIVIQDGKFLKENMHKIKYSIDNILTMLRENGVFNVEDVELALVEPNGKLTVSRKPEASSVTKQELGIHTGGSKIAFPVIFEGNIQQEVLSSLGLPENWVLNQLQANGISDIREVFFASITHKRELYISLYNEPINNDYPLIR